MGEGRKISVDEKEFFNFMTSSEQIFMPRDNVEKRKIINKNFHDSCMFVRIAKQGYMVGTLNWTDAMHYSMTVNGEEMRFSYSETEAIFKPKLC